MPDTANPYTLLTEATVLSEAALGVDPVKEARLTSANLQAIEPRYEAPPPPELPELDPTPNAPYRVALGAVTAQLEISAPEVLEAVNADQIGFAVTSLNHLPRDLVAVMDEEGEFASPVTWHLLGEIGEQLIITGATPSAERLEFTPANLEAYAAGVPALAAHVREMAARDPFALGHLAVVLGSLPRPVLDALRVHQDNAELWDLGARLGSRLWGFTLRKPERI